MRLSGGEEKEAEKRTRVEFPRREMRREQESERHHIKEITQASRARRCRTYQIPRQQSFATLDCAAVRIKFASLPSLKPQTRGGTEGGGPDLPEARTGRRE